MAIRTDLALEAREMFANEISGVESHEEENDRIKITRVKVTTDEGAKKIGKPKGNYITIEISDMQYENDEICQRGADVLAEEIEKLLNLKPETSAFVVGLGNQYITPDSIGPKTVGKLFVTRHLNGIKVNNEELKFRSVSAVAPGVLGLTGIETGEIVEGINERTKPDVIICVDALASRKLSRLGSTIQLSDTGINPGSGVGNNRKELSQKTLGVPVIAIGVPMVVDAATLADDAIGIIENHITKSGKTNFYNMLGNLNENERNDLISEALSKQDSNMIVTPNNVDVISEQASTIIAEGINIALHGKE